MAGIGPLYFIINADLQALGMGITAFMAILAGFVVSIAGPNIKAMMLDVNTPETRGVALALQSVTDDLGKGLGPVIVAGFINMLGRRQAFNLAVAGWIPCGLLILGIMFCITKDEAGMQKKLKEKSEVVVEEIEHRRTVSSGDGAGREGVEATVWHTGDVNGVLESGLYLPKSQKGASVMGSPRGFGFIKALSPKAVHRRGGSGSAGAAAAAAAGQMQPLLSEGRVLSHDGGGGGSSSRGRRSSWDAGRLEGQQQQRQQQRGEGKGWSWHGEQAVEDVLLPGQAAGQRVCGGRAGQRRSSSKAGSSSSSGSGSSSASRQQQVLASGGGSGEANSAGGGSLGGRGVEDGEIGGKGWVSWDECGGTAWGPSGARAVIKGHGRSVDSGSLSCSADGGAHGRAAAVGGGGGVARGFSAPAAAGGNVALYAAAAAPTC